MARPMSEALLGADPRPQASGQGFLARWAGELAALWPSRSGRLPKDNLVALYDGKALPFVATGRGRIEEIGVVDCPTDGRGSDRNADLLADQIRHSGLPLGLRLRCRPRARDIRPAAANGQ